MKENGLGSLGRMLGYILTYSRRHRRTDRDKKNWRHRGVKV